MDFYHSRLYHAVRLERHVSLRRVRWLRITLLLAAVAAAALAVAGSSPALLGASLLLFPAAISLGFWEIFVVYGLRKGRVSHDGATDAFDQLLFDAMLLLDRARAFAQRRKQEEVSVTDVLLALFQSSDARGALMRLELDARECADRCQDWIGVAPPRWRSGIGGFERRVPFDSGVTALLESARTVAASHGESVISTLDIMVALMDYADAFRRLMLERGFERADLSRLASWHEADQRYWALRRMWWRRENLLRRASVGLSWTYGHTPYLNRYGTDLTRTFRESVKKPFVVGRAELLRRMEEVLTRGERQNVLLVGEPGVGKRTLIYGFAERIARGASLAALNDVRLMEFDIAQIVSSATEPGIARSLLMRLALEAATAGNIVLVFHDLHLIVGGIGGIAESEVAEILLPLVRSSRVPIIATTTPVSFHKELQTRETWAALFDVVRVEEPALEEVTRILEETVPVLESREKVFVTYGALKAVVDDADRYLTNAPFPEKAVDLLLEALSSVRSRRASVLRAQDVHDVVSRKTSLPLGAVEAGERATLLSLADEMHRLIIDQEAAVTAVASTLQRLRAGVVRRGKPAGTFLFLGPTGVGKTLTAKVLSKVYFGAEDRMIRFDMSEFQTGESAERLIGSVVLNEPGQLASAARDKPFAVLLLDEFEKAHPSVHNLFLQVLDEGHITDAFGRKVSFEQTIVIATSNAGADRIREWVKAGEDPVRHREDLTDLLVRSGIFTPELLNRFDEIVIFRSLSREHVRSIAELLLRQLSERLLDQGYVFAATPELAAWVADRGYDPEFGARPMQRVIQRTVETVVSQRILRGEIKKGESFSVSPHELTEDPAV